jgi:hypothetical protein
MNTKLWWQSKMLWFNVLSGLVLVIGYLVDNQLFVEYAAWEAAAVAIINVILRAITNTGVTTKKES